MEAVIAVIALSGLVGFARLLGATRANNHSLARGVLHELAALRGIPPRIDKLVDANGLDLVERGYAVTVAVGTRAPFSECRVAIPPPGLPAFTVTCDGLTDTAIQCSEPGLRDLLERWVREHRASLSDVTGSRVPDGACGSPSRARDAPLAATRTIARCVSLELASDVSMSFDAPVR